MSAQKQLGQNPIRVMIVEDYKLQRIGLKLALKEFPNIEVVAETGCGETALEFANIYRPSVILMDLGLPGINGLEATSKIRIEHPEIKVIVLTSHGLEEDIRASLGAGATGYCLKDIEPKILSDVINTVNTGACWIDPTVARQALRCFAKTESFSKFSFRQREEKVHLTQREQEILKLMSEGKNNTEIAKELIISVHTAKAHSCNIMRKLDVTDRTQAAVKAVREGLIS